MKQYQVTNDCHLGKKGDTLSLNDRQAVFLLAGGFIIPLTQNKKESKK